MVDTPTTEPTELVAGDTWEWRREDLTADYPASAWALSYTFHSASGRFDVAASADGDAFAVTVAKTTTVDYAAGTYHWQAYVTRLSDGVRKTVDSGTLKVLPNLATAAATYDPRSHARIALAAIEAVLERRATLDQQSFSIEGRSLARTPIADLIRLRDYYRREVKREEQAERIANGMASGLDVAVRFGRA